MIRLPEILDSSFVVTGHIAPITMSINENLIPLSSASMEVLKEDLLPIRTYVRLYSPNGKVEIYRTRQPRTTHGSENASMQLDHAICEVGDWIIQDAIKEDVTVAEAFSHIFAHYRGDKWQMGTISASETVTLDCDYDNVLETMLGILKQVPQYVMTFDFTTSPWTFSLAQKTTTVNAEGRVSRNIASATINYDDKDLCTRVYVKGLPKPVGRENDDNAIGYMDADTQSVYGIVEAQTGSGDLTEEQATRTATAYLNAHKHPKRSLDIDGDDLSQITGENLDTFVTGKLFRLTIPHKSVVIEDYITKIVWNDVLSNKCSAKMTVGEDMNDALKFMKDQASKSKSSRKSAKKQDKINEGLGHKIEETDQHWRSIYWDGYNGLSSRIEQTAAYWQAEFVDAYNGLHSLIDITAQHWQSTFEDTYYNLISRVEQTAAYWRSDIANMYSGLSSRVEQTESSWSATVQAIGYNGEINAGTIAIAINNAGESEARIDANKVYIGNSKSTTVISGKCELSDVTADYIKSQIEDIALLNVQAIASTATSGGSSYASLNEFKGNYFKVNMGSSGGQPLPAKDLCDGVYDLQIVDNNNNTYTLQKKAIKDSSWTDVGTFSRAASSLSGSWGGTNDTFPLTVTDGVNTYDIDFIDTSSPGSADVKLFVDTGTTSKNTSNKKNLDVPVLIKTYVSGSPPTLTQRYSETVTVSAESVYNAGSADVVLDSSYTWTTTPSSGITASNNGVTVSTSGRKDTSGTTDEDTKTINFYSQGSVSGTTATVYVTHTDSTDNNRILKKTVDCSSVYYSGSASVLISSSLAWTTTPSSSISTSNNGVTISTSGRTDSGGTADEDTKTINLYSQSSISGQNAIVYITHTNSTDANRIIKKTVDCTSIYNNGSPSSLALGSKYSNMTWNFTVTKGDGTTVTKTADCSSIYTDARVGYYTQAQYDSHYKDGVTTGWQSVWFHWSSSPKSTNYGVNDAVGLYMTAHYTDANGVYREWDTSWGPIPSGVAPTSGNIQIDSYEYRSSQPSGTQAQNMWTSIKNGQSDPTMKYWRFRVYVQNPNNTSQKLCEKYYWFQYT